MTARLQDYTIENHITLPFLHFTFSIFPIVSLFTSHFSLLTKPCQAH